MDKREIAALICKALSLYVFISALNSLPLLCGPALTALTPTTPNVSFIENTPRLELIINALPILLDIVAGVLLWCGADTLARHMVKSAAATPTIAVGPAAQTLVFSALGLFTLLQVIPHIGQIAARLYLLHQQDVLMQPDYKGLAAPDLVSVVMQAGLGLWLLFGATGLVKWLQSLRSVGVDKQNSVAIEP